MKLIAILLLFTCTAQAQTIHTSAVIYHSTGDRLMYREVDSIRFVGVPGVKHYYLGNTWEHVSIIAYKSPKPVPARDHWPGINDGWRDTIYCQQVAHTKKNKSHVLVSKVKYLVRTVEKGLFVYRTDRRTLVYPFKIWNGSTWMDVESDWIL